MSKKVYQELRDMYTYCQNCGSTSYLEIHHIKKRSQGGKDTLENLVLLCRDCHMRAHGQVVGGQEPIELRYDSGNLCAFNSYGKRLSIIERESHEPTELDGQNAYTLNQNIKVHARIFQSSGLELGRLLYQMHENDMYQALGYESFKEYVSRELPIGPGMAYRLKQVAGHQERLQIESESLEGIAVDTLTYVLPKATADTVDDLLNQARSNSFSDLKADIEEEPIPDPSKPDPCPNCSMDCCPIKRGLV